MDSSLQQQEYKVVTRAELATAGYIRIHTSKNVNIPPWIRSLCFEYFGFFFLPPNKDPSNFISSSDIKTANTLRQEGNKYIKQKNYAEAIKQYTKSLSLNINDGKTRSNRCLCYLKSNDLDKAFSDARHAIYNEPLWYKSWLRMAQVFEAKEWYSECLDMILQSIMICDNFKDKKNEKILEKYYHSVSSKKDEFYELYPERNNIDHMNDDDRLEWKHCKDGFIKEDFMNIEKLMEAPPWKIYFYREGITPKRLAKGVSDTECDYKTKANEYYDHSTDSLDDEYNRWMERKWLKKICLFGKLNYYKMLLSADKIIEGTVVRNNNEVWTVSWSALNGLYLNKRYFTFNINTSDDKKCIFMAGRYCKPNAQFIIQCIKFAIISPLDGMFRMMNHMMNGGNIKDWMAERKPIRIDIQYRMKDEYDEIAFAMFRYGIRCYLMPFDDDLLRSCRKYNTDPHGWNYMDSAPYYRYDRDNDM